MKPEQVLQYSISHRPSTGIYVYSDWSPTNEHPATTNISQAHSTWQPWSKPRCQYTVDTLKTTFPKSSREHRYRWSHNAQKKRVQVQCALTPTHPQTLRRSPNQWAKLSIAEEKNNSWRRFHGLIGASTISSRLVLIGWWHSCKFQWAKHTKKHLAFCQSCQYFINLQLRQSITKHFTNHSMTTISCPTPGLEIIQHASQRPREVCKQPGIKTGVTRRTHTVCVS